MGCKLAVFHMHVLVRSGCVVLFLVLSVRAATAQLIPGWDTKQFTIERIDADRVRLMREVEVNGVGPNAGQQIFADDLTFNTATGEFTASGNVTLVSPTARLSADSVTFNTKTGLGTFVTAFGMASLGERGAEVKSMFGTLEPDVYFYGKTIEKIGEDRYRITNGGFTTCVQPTPRWDIVSNSATIDVGDYAILRNAVMRVKDVPIFYLPIMYYPIQDDDRATGFLLPTYGNTTYRGSSISNAFFWAINRSQDATFFHDWMLRRGQGAGAEYRYALGAGSEGSVRAYWLDEKQGLIAGAPTPERRSYEVRGSVVQRLPGGVDGRAIVDYFSNLTAKQLYNNNIFDSSLGRRQVSGALTKAWSAVTVNGIYQRSESFYTATNSVVQGSAPSATAALSSQQIANLPIYVGANAAATRLLSLQRSLENDVITEVDRSLDTIDLNGTVRSPFSRLPFLTATGSITLRYGRFSRSLDPLGNYIDEPVSRLYGDMALDVLGPTVSRVFTPNNALADRLKHVIEPQFTIQRTTAIEQESRFATYGTTPVVGDNTRITYGFANRLLVRKTAADPAMASASAPRELLALVVSQSYYSNERASGADYSYGFSYGYRPDNSFSPLLVSLRGQPTAATQVNFRFEYDPIALSDKLQGFSLDGGINRTLVQATAGWSQRRYGSGNAQAPDDYLQAQSTIRTANQRFALTAGINFDISRGSLTQHRWTGSYNAQCCGIAIEYQEHNYPAGVTRFVVNRDRRFNLSFTLAGIGTFSNFLGAFGGGGGSNRF